MPHTLCPLSSCSSLLSWFSFWVCSEERECFDISLEQELLLEGISLPFLALLMLQMRLLAAELFGRVVELKITGGLLAVQLMGWVGDEGLAGWLLFVRLNGLDVL